MKKEFDEAIKNLQRLKVRQVDAVRQEIDRIIGGLRGWEEGIGFQSYLGLATEIVNALSNRDVDESAIHVVTEVLMRRVPITEILTKDENEEKEPTDFRHARAEAIEEYLRLHPADGRYLIGERVEVRYNGGDPVNRNDWNPATVMIVDHSGGHIRDTAEFDVRRIPWRPKQGEPVLFSVCGMAAAGFWDESIGGIAHMAIRYSPEPGKSMLPYDASKWGRPWNEVAP